MYITSWRHTQHDSHIKYSPSMFNTFSSYNDMLQIHKHKTDANINVIYIKLAMWDMAIRTTLYRLTYITVIMI